MENTLRRKVVRNMVRARAGNDNLQKTWSAMQFRKFGEKQLYKLWKASGKKVTKKDEQLPERG